MIHRVKRNRKLSTNQSCEQTFPHVHSISYLLPRLYSCIPLSRNSLFVCEKSYLEPVLAFRNLASVRAPPPSFLPPPSPFPGATTPGRKKEQKKSIRI